ncbi:MAG TPA: helix-hairpin-helix domain-containing protein [Terriglobia bacterium]|nr:helix-hairpin-helix domain-containing protein [Terriglobia bacterium]
MAKANVKRNRFRPRELRDLVSVGPATLRNFEQLGIRSVVQLARAHPEALYEKLCRVTGQSQDICCFDVFSAAVAQARNPQLPVVQCQWWYWSRKRKASDSRKAS